MVELIISPLQGLIAFGMHWAIIFAPLRGRIQISHYKIWNRFATRNQWFKKIETKK